MNEGVYVAVITPFLEDESIDYPSLAALIKSLCESDCQGLVLLGTTAETPTLSEDEQVHLLHFCQQIIQKRKPIVVCISLPDTKSIAYRIRRFSFFPIQAFLLTTPFYIKTNEDGMFQHYAKIAAMTPIPILLYNVPARTGYCFTPALLNRLKTIPSIIGIKEAHNDLTYLQQVFLLQDEHFSVYCGNDDLNYFFFSHGAKGCISVLANAFAKEITALYQKVQHRASDAFTYHRQLSVLYPILKIEPNPIGIKEYLALEGKIQPFFRLPLTRATVEHQQLIQQIQERWNAR